MVINGASSPAVRFVPPSPDGPGGSPLVSHEGSIYSVAQSQETPRIAGKRVKFLEDPETDTAPLNIPGRSPSPKRSALRRKSPTPFSGESLPDLTPEQKKLFEVTRLRMIFSQKLQDALKDPQNEEQIEECVVTLRNSKRLFDSAMHLIEPQEQLQNSDVVAKILRKYLFTHTSISTQNKLPDILKQVEMRLTHSNIEEVVEYLVLNKRELKIDALVLLEVAGRDVRTFSELKAEIVPAYQKVFKDEATTFKELFARFRVQPENGSLLSEIVQCMIRIYKKGLRVDPIDQLDLVLEESKLSTDKKDFFKKCIITQFALSRDGFTYLSQELADLLRSEIIDKALSFSPERVQLITEELERTLAIYEVYEVDSIRLLRSAWEQAIHQRETKVAHISIGQRVVQTVKGRKLFRQLTIEPANRSVLSSMASCLALLEQHGKDAIPFLGQLLSTVQEPLKNQLRTGILLQLKAFLLAADHFALSLVSAFEGGKSQCSSEEIEQFFSGFLKKCKENGLNLIHLIDYAWHEAKKKRPTLTEEFPHAEKIVQDLKSRLFFQANDSHAT